MAGNLLSQAVDALGQRIIRLDFRCHLAIVRRVGDHEVFVRDNGRDGVAELRLKLAAHVLRAGGNAREDDFGTRLDVRPVLEDLESLAHVVDFVCPVYHST